MEAAPEGGAAVRAMNVVRDAPQRQDDVSEIQYRWTAAQRVLLLEDKLDCLVTVLARLATALERRAAP